MTEDKMVEWHHRLSGCEFQQAMGDGKGQGSLACCRPWGRKEQDMTERGNNKRKKKTNQNTPQNGETEGLLRFSIH